jgi:hypothetical protein
MALPAGLLLGVVFSRIPGWRRAMERDRREMLAYQRGEAPYPSAGLPTMDVTSS